MEYVSKEEREVMLGYPKVLVCDAGASGPKPSLTAEASGHSQRGFSVYSCSLVLVCVCATMFPSTRDSSKPKKHKIACMQCMCIYLCKHMCHRGDVCVLCCMKSG